MQICCPPRTRDLCRLCLTVIILLLTTTLFAAEKGSYTLADQPVIILPSDQALSMGGSLYYFRDSTGLLDLADVRAKAMHRSWQKSADVSATIGETGDIIWYHGVFAVPLAGPKLWFFLANNSLLNTLDIWFLHDNTVVNQLLGGTERPFSLHNIDSADNSLVLTLQPGQQYQFFARVASHNWIDFPSRISPLDHHLGARETQSLGYGLFYGIMLTILFYHFTLYLGLKDPAYLYYTLFTGAVTAFFSSIDGRGFYYLWSFSPAFNDYATYMFVTLATISAALFSRTFLNLKIHFPLWDKLFYYASILCMLLLVLMPVIPRELMLKPIVSITAVLFVSFVVVGALCWKKGIDYASHYAISWLLISTIFIWIALGILEIVQMTIGYLWDILRQAFLLQLILLSIGLSVRIASINKQRDSAQAQSQAKSDMIAHVSHEIRTPMNGILGMSELLSERLDDPTSIRYNTIIYQSGSALLGVINDLLDLARIEAEKLTISQQPLNLYQLCEQSLFVIEAQILNRDIELNIDYDKALPLWFSGDSTRLRQITINFLNNSQKFTSNGKITIRVKHCELISGNINIAVIDSGSGIPDKLLPNLLNAFSQDEYDTEKAKLGTGLGLFISNRLAKLMRGKLFFHTELGSGSEFSVSVPIKPCPAPHAAPPVEQETIALPPGLHVLVAEDNKVNQIIVEKILEKYDCKIHVVVNGQQAIDYFRDHRDIDIIIMDCEMPVCDGHDATAQIRQIEQQQQWRRLPIVALTAHALDGHRELFLASGMDDMLTKPVKSEDLILKLQQLIRAPNLH